MGSSGGGGGPRPTPAQRRAAEAIKGEGNTLFAKGKYGAAAEKYTEGIVEDPSLIALFINRGMCYKKLGRWAAVASDADSALSLSSGNVKAHYLAGCARRELGQLGAAVAHLAKALEAAREHGDAIRDDIWREFARAKYAAWQADSSARADADAALRGQLEQLLPAAPATAQRQQQSSEQQQQQQQQLLQQPSEQQQQQQEEQPPPDQPSLQSALARLFERAGARDVRGEVPSCFTCPLTMEVFREPVLAVPSGISYERAALLEHLTKVGAFCPVTRKPLSKAELAPNVGLRVATQQYLDDHPWAWGECT